MKRLVVATVAALALIAAAPASAEPKPSNGCGDAFAMLAAPGFGQAVSDAARTGGFDDEVQFFCRGF